MNELIRIQVKEDGSQVVSARELYEALGFDVKNWSRWSTKNIENNSFVVEGQDFEGVFIEKSGNNIKDFAITIDFAKRLSMMARTEKGEEVRNYFIECEKLAKQKMEVAAPQQFQLPANYIEALEALLESKKSEQKLLESNSKLVEVITEQKPKVEFYDQVADGTGSFDLREVSGLLKLKYGRNTLFKKLRDLQILQDDNMPYRNYLDSGHFIVVESSWTNPKTQEVNLTRQTRITQKGIVYLQERIEKFKL